MGDVPSLGPVLTYRRFSDPVKNRRRDKRDFRSEKDLHTFKKMKN